MKQIGFCHGVTHKIHDVYSKKNIDVFKNCGCSAIEINLHSVAESDKWESLLPLINGFEYVSLHTPSDIRYKNDDKTKELLKKIEDFYIKSGARLAVVHPDVVDDWDVFNNYSIDFAIENMDDRKEKFQYKKDLKEFFEKHKHWGFVLDLGHCNANDKTMALADDLISALKDKVKEIHLSGYKVFHDPLHRTKQTEIIKYCKELDVPIIIESTFEISDGIPAVKKEYEYILENLTK